MPVETQYDVELTCDRCGAEVDKLHGYTLSSREAEREDYIKRAKNKLAGRSSLTWTGRGKIEVCGECNEELGRTLHDIFA